MRASGRLARRRTPTPRAWSLARKATRPAPAARSGSATCTCRPRRSRTASTARASATARTRTPSGARSVPTASSAARRSPSVRPACAAATAFATTPAPPPKREASVPTSGAVGAEAERRVGAHLERLGFRVVARNFRSRWGEIDLIASRPGEIHFVEVRARSTETFVTAAESIDARKQARIRRTAEVYLAKKARPFAQAFFDVATVVGDRVELLVGAFE
ncbi:MAG: YraN family protein [Deltaproteobacteria bacterium]|nr:YraN family protein [Deltaproteobacteria bacterium]